MYRAKDLGELSQAIQLRIKELHDYAPESIGDLMHYRLVECKEDTGECILECDTFPWMRNGPGTLHGGMCATIVDQAMGFVAYCIKPGEGIAPTVQMQIAYHRPLIPGQSARVIVRIVSVTKTLMHLSAEVFQLTAPEKLCLSATGIYCYKPMPIPGARENKKI